MDMAGTLTSRRRQCRPLPAVGAAPSLGSDEVVFRAAQPDKQLVEAPVLREC
jgi:hypothetical protein